MARSTRRVIDTNGKPWARYLRLSKLEAAEMRGMTKDERLALTVKKLEEHLTELTAWMDERDIPYDDAHVYMDPGLSAWKRNVKRPAWDSMMDAAESGEVAGIGIVAVDRFTRDVVVMEGLIRLAETTDVQIGGPRAGRLNLTTYEGIQQARGMAMQAANESLATSFRIKETLGRKMKAGKPMGGGRCFGFDVGGVVQRPEEVAVVREIAARMLAGETLQALAKDMNGRGLTTTRGYPWTGANLGRLLSHKRYGGEVEHNGAVVGTMPGEPVLDRDTYDGVQALLMSRRRGRRPTGRYPLTGLLTCSTCQRPMNGATRSKPLADGTKPRIYRCPVQLGGCGRVILAEPTEELVDEHMVELLSDPDNAAKVIAKSAEIGQARAAVQAKLDALDRRRRNMTVKYAAEELSDDDYEAGLAMLARQRAKVQAAMDELAPAVVLAGYDADADWKDMDDDEKRAMIRQHRVRIEILPYRGGRRFDSGRVTFPDRD